VECESFQNQVVLEKLKRRVLALKSQVFVEWARRRFLEEAGGQPDAFRVGRKFLRSGACKSLLLRAMSWEIGLCWKYMVSTRGEIRVTCDMA